MARNNREAYVIWEISVELSVRFGGVGACCDGGGRVGTRSFCGTERSLSLAGRHPRRKTARLGQGAKRAQPPSAAGRPALPEVLRRNSEGAGRAGPHPLRIAATELCLQFLAGRRQPKRHLAPHHHRRLPDREPQMGNPSRHRQAVERRRQKLGVQGRGLHTRSQALSRRTVARRRRRKGGARI